ncbi:MAG: radical SAM protein [Chloroflexi bacterium]|nr:radical SAM protein [Chloroflexota bacterium]
MAAYLELYYSGKLAERVKAAGVLLENCQVCPRHCGINRLADEAGQCHTGKLAIVSSYVPHFGEEAPLVGNLGSGTIFFTNCNLKCLFCQNYTISQLGDGTEASKEELAKMMLALQARGCHNINLVSPTHVIPQILEALEIAINLGLRLPLVYNSGGYDAVKTLEILDGIVDIYMPDMKYSNEKTAEELSGIKNYPSINRAALKEMHRQVGDLQMDEDGIAVRGLLIRHLVLPHELAGTKEIMKFIAEEISQNSYVNVMAQYHPCYKALHIPQLTKPLLRQEFLEAIELAKRSGLNRLDRLYPVTARAI